MEWHALDMILSAMYLETNGPDTSDWTNIFKEKQHNKIITIINIVNDEIFLMLQHSRLRITIEKQTSNWKVTLSNDIIACIETQPIFEEFVDNMEALDRFFGSNDERIEFHVSNLNVDIRVNKNNEISIHHDNPRLDYMQTLDADQLQNIALQMLLAPGVLKMYCTFNKFNRASLNGDVLSFDVNYEGNIRSISFAFQCPNIIVNVTENGIMIITNTTISEERCFECIQRIETNGTHKLINSMTESNRALTPRKA